MCPPDYYGIEYEINPWMNRAGRQRPGRVARQWRALHDTLVDLGVRDRAARRRAGPARPGLHGERRAGLSATCSSARGSATASGRGRRPTSTAGPRRTGSRSSPCPPGALLRGGRATPSSAARPCSPAIGSAATPGATTGSASGWASRSSRWNWSTRGSITSTPASARSPRTRRSTTPARSTTTAGRSCAAGSPRLIEVSAEEAVSFSCNAVVVGRTVVLNDGRAEAGPVARATRATRSIRSA